MTATKHDPMPHGIFKGRVDHYKSFGGPDVFEAATAAAHITYRDLEILRREGRTDAAAGAAHLLGTLVRRHCLTLAMSSDEAAVKVESLDSFLPFYEQEDDPLMMAMIEYARHFERQRWSNK